MYLLQHASTISCQVFWGEKRDFALLQDASIAAIIAAAPERAPQGYRKLAALPEAHSLDYSQSNTALPMQTGK